MNWLIDLFYSNDVTAQTTMLRLFLSFLAGGIIGFERETHQQPAGLRTHMLICIGSTLVMLLSIYIPQAFNLMSNGGDPGRIAAQVVSGVGFIGAGAILKMGVNVRGLTTAASVWTIAAIGLAIGAGMYLTAFLALIMVMVTLIVMELIEKRIFIPHVVKQLTITSKQPIDEIGIRELLEDLNIHIIDVNPSFTKEQYFKVNYLIGSRSRLIWSEITKRLHGISGIESASIEAPIV
jgi:putative Mg2+ transporter-C (MgtC) family protein